MKVLHIMDSLDIERGGLPAALDLILKMEKRMGVEHQVLSTQQKKDRPIKPLNISDENVHLAPLSFPFRFYNSNSAISWLEKHGRSFDLIVIHGIWQLMAIRGAEWASRNKVKYVVWPHGSLIPFDLRKKKILKNIMGPLLIGPMLENALSVLCTSEMEEEMLEKYRRNPTVRILPLPVDYSPPLVADTVTDGYRLPVDKTDFVFLFMCRISFVKRLDLVLESMAEIVENNPNTKLVIAGSYADEKLERELRSKILALDLGDNIIHTGWVDETRKYTILSRADCLLLPSMGENFGIVTVEALECGVPVIISPYVSIWKPIINSEAGLLADTTVSSLHDCMKKIVLNRDLFLKLKGNTKKAASYFTSDNLEPLYRQVYSEFSGNVI